MSTLTLSEVAARVADILRDRPTSDLMHTGIKEISVRDNAVVFDGVMGWTEIMRIQADRDNFRDDARHFEFENERLKDRLDDLQEEFARYKEKHPAK